MIKRLIESLDDDYPYIYNYNEDIPSGDPQFDDELRSYDGNKVKVINGDPDTDEIVEVETMDGSQFDAYSIELSLY